jgi:PTS system mannose-specific IIC component
MITDVIIASIVGGIFCLDRVSVLFMVSRPIVAAPVIGFLLGDTYTGLVAGALTELLWIDRLPIGMYQPPNDTITALLIAASSIETGRVLGILPDSLITLSVLLFVPFGLLAQKMDRFLLTANGKLADRFIEDLKNADSERVSRRHLSPLFKTWAYSAGFIIAALFIGITLLVFSYPLLPRWSIQGLDLFYPMIPLIGTAVALNSIKVRGALPVFSGAFLLGSVLFHYLKEMG